MSPSQQPMDERFARAFRHELEESVRRGDESWWRKAARRPVRAAGISGIAIALAAGGAVAVTAILPGGTESTPLAQAVVVERTGTATVELGTRPDHASAVALEFTCLSAGHFSFPDGASVACSADEVAAGGHRVTTGYPLALAPGQHSVTISAPDGARWRLSATYVVTKTRPWAVNAKGQTYGVANEQGEPDLIAVMASNGKVGYAYSSELNGPQPTSPEDAVKGNGQSRTVRVYLSDGETVVGEFIVGAGTATTTH